MKFHKDGTQPTNDQAIFVFGSNQAGRHGAGAAKAALDFYGARMGVGKGHVGRSYALPTKDHRIESLSLEQIKAHVEDFKSYAMRNPQYEFFMTSVGTVLAGYSVEDIAPMFYPPQDNIDYPDTWRPIFLKCSKDVK